MHFDQATIQALSHISTSGVWAVFWWSFFDHFADIFMCVFFAIVVRTGWKYFKATAEARSKTNK